MRDRGEESIGRELEALSGRPEIASQVKESLRRMRDGEAGPEMAEMSRDLLEGRIRLRDLATTEVYADGLTAGVERYRRWESELTPEDRQKLDEEVQKLRDGGDGPGPAAASSARRP
ncbi:MAG TPA: hypothetical protein VFG35_12750 [Actinoplanes sp.]|nr:hypothetical protein [Actinoplanes sp.]